MYCFCNYRSAKDGSGSKEPDVPPSTSFFTLGSGKNTDWCLCEVFFEEAQTDLEFVSKELEILLDSAKRYPPALAISLHNANLELPLSKSEYQTLLVGMIKEKLNNQQNDSFFLAESTIEETGYLSIGEFVWVLRFYPETNEVSWVSSDYFIYRNSTNDFIVSEKQLQEISTSQTNK